MRTYGWSLSRFSVQETQALSGVQSVPVSTNGAISTQSVAIVVTIDNNAVPGASR